MSEMKRIVMHWTAGGHAANDEDRDSYHEIVEADGTRVRGRLLPEANIDTGDGSYVPHTRKFNTRAVGLSMAGMTGAEPRPFRKGGSPLTEDQVEAFVRMVAEYADTYDIEVTRRDVLTHREVEVTHGIAQPGKWDITWLPGMERPGDALEVGDELRRRVRAAQADGFRGAPRPSSDQQALADALAAILAGLSTARA